jgi:hypothetical protein
VTLALKSVMNVRRASISKTISASTVIGDAMSAMMRLRCAMNAKRDSGLRKESASHAIRISVIVVTKINACNARQDFG